MPAAHDGGGTDACVREVRQTLEPVTYNRIQLMNRRLNEVCVLGNTSASVRLLSSSHNTYFAAMRLSRNKLCLIKKPFRFGTVQMYVTALGPRDVAGRGAFPYPSPRASSWHLFSVSAASSDEPPVCQMF